MDRIFRPVILAFVITVSFFMVSCGQTGQNPWIGTWHGSIIFVNVEYIFSVDGMEMKTLSANNVLIASAKARIRVEPGVMHITETERYVFDQDKGTGAWSPSNDSYDASFKIEGGQMKFQPSTSSISLELTKQ